jgi:hypothetical protein
VRCATGLHVVQVVPTSPVQHQASLSAWRLADSAPRCCHLSTCCVPLQSNPNRPGAFCGPELRSCAASALVALPCVGLAHNKSEGCCGMLRLLAAPVSRRCLPSTTSYACTRWDLGLGPSLCACLAPWFTLTDCACPLARGTSAVGPCPLGIYFLREVWPARTTRQNTQRSTGSACCRLMQAVNAPHMLSS